MRRKRETPEQRAAYLDALTQSIGRGREQQTINAARLLFSIMLTDETAEGVPCGGCGVPLDVRPGPVLCVASPASPVCRACAWLIAPALVELLEVAEVANISNPAGAYWRGCLLASESGAGVAGERAA